MVTSTKNEQAINSKDNTKHIPSIARDPLSNVHTEKMNFSQIKSACIYRITTPFLKEISFKNNKIKERCSLILKLNFIDGSESTGEVSPLIGFSKETFDDCQSALISLLTELIKLTALPQKNIKPVSHLKKSHKLNAIYNKVNNLPPSARFAFDCAVQKITSATDFSRTHQVPLIIANTSEQALKEYYRLEEPNKIKFKVARSNTMKGIKNDISIITALSECNQDLTFNLDANQGWSSEQALEFYQQLPSEIKTRINYIEEPCHNWPKSINFSKKTKINIAIDESLMSLLSQSIGKYCDMKDPDNDSDEALWKEIKEVFSFNLVKTAVVKPTLLGSLEKLNQLIEIGNNTQTNLYLSSSFESKLGIGQLHQLAQSKLPNNEHGFDTLKFMNVKESEMKSQELVWES